MELKFKSTAIRDLDYWKKTEKQKILNRIGELIKSTLETPFDGIGKPEPLRYNLTGYWSRRINREHRMIYRVQDDEIVIHSLRGHYFDFSEK
ncbi:MAG: Txe/YoeB family addiction module toxin [bacterium]|nr:Txe/YoeB family addiction module toxin [Candidatus Limimorpha caballi]